MREKSFILYLILMELLKVFQLSSKKDQLILINKNDGINKNIKINC